jgi:hypothetical protein
MSKKSSYYLSIVIISAPFRARSGKSRSRVTSRHFNLSKVWWQAERLYKPEKRM